MDGDARQADEAVGRADLAAVRPGDPAGVADADLLAAHVAGDPEAFAELVRRHRDRMWAVALRTSGDPEDAADAVQEALISAYRRAGSFRGEAAVSTWLHRIVVNACLDRHRARQSRPQVPLLDDRLTIADGADHIAARDIRLDLAEALAALPFDQRAAIVLVDVEGRSVQEAADLLGVPTGTVKSRCARGRARLAVMLRDHDPRRAGRDPHEIGRNRPQPDAVPPPDEPTSSPVDGGEHP